MTRAACLFCGGKASLLCDSYLGWERKRGEMQADGYDGVVEGPGYLVPIKYRTRHTCDASLCIACAIPRGMMFVSMKNCGFAESIDYCPGHGFGNLREEITGLQAQAIRAKWRAAAREARQQADPQSAQIGLFTGLLA